MESTFFARYAALCKARGETPNSVAKLIGASSGSVTAWKKGTDPRNATLLKIADYFKVSVDYLLGKEDNLPTKVGAREITDEDIQFALFGGNDAITEKMYEEVKRFVSYLKQWDGYHK